MYEARGLDRFNAVHTFICGTFIYSHQMIPMFSACDGILPQSSSSCPSNDETDTVIHVVLMEIKDTQIELKDFSTIRSNPSYAVVTPEMKSNSGSQNLCSISLSDNHNISDACNACWEGHQKHLKGQEVWSQMT